MHELYFPTQIFDVGTSFSQEYFIFFADFILANIVTLNSTSGLS